MVMNIPTDTNFEFFDLPGRRPIKAWIRGVTLDDTARQQLFNLATLTFIHPHVAVIPGAHAGKGSTIGSVIPTLRAIIPAAVGVDLGCGMMAVRTSLKASDLPDDLKPLRAAIEQSVPVGSVAWHNLGPGDPAYKPV